MVLADLHIHTCLSPCADIEMTPSLIVNKALENGLGLIGITDHNSTLQALEVARIGTSKGLIVLCGAEINTSEEVHVLVFVPTEKLALLQQFIDDNLPFVANRPDFFGYQVMVDEQENIILHEQRLLLTALTKSFDEVFEFCKSIGGIFIPAHADKPSNSIISQLGFIPTDISIDAIEITPFADIDSLKKAGIIPEQYTPIRSSDSHFPDQIGSGKIELETVGNSFVEIKNAIIEYSKR